MVEYIELKNIKKQQRKDKIRKIIKKTRKGAEIIGKKVSAGAKVISKGTGELAKKGYESYKESRTPEAQEKKLVFQERMAKRRARIAKLQPKGTGGFGAMPGFGSGFLRGGGGGFGFKPLDMGNVLTGGQQRQPRKKKGKPFDPLSQI